MNNRIMNPKNTILDPSPQNPPRRRRTTGRQLLPLLAGSVLALAVQTPVLAQSDTGLINFYANTGAGTVTGPAVLGSSPSDIWNAVGASSPTDAAGNPITASVSITGSQATGASGDADPTTDTLLNNCFWALIYWGGNTLSINISGLAPNTEYTNVTYIEGNQGGGAGGVINWTDGTGTLLTATVLNPNPIPDPDPYVSGQNYAVLIGQSSATGTIDYTVSLPPGNVVSLWNGVQLMPVYVSPVPAITVQPQSATVTAGNTAWFTVVATGASPLAYQWSLSDGTILANNGHFAGCTNATLIITNVGFADANVSYLVTVTNSSGTVTSQAATLTVMPLATNMVNFYAYGSQIMSGPAVVGSTTDTWNQVNSALSTFYSTFTVTTANQTVVDVQGNTVGDNFSITCGGGFFGNDNTQYTSPATANLFNDCFLDFFGSSISVSVTGLAANTDYVMYNYTIGNSGSTGGTLTWIDGTGKTLTATADNVQWTPAAFVLNQNYTVLTGQSDGSGSINFTLSGIAYPCWNGMQIFPAPPVPIISVQPQSTTNSLGSTAQFTVVAAGAGLAYQWSLNSTPLTGATNATLTVNNVGAANAGSYEVTVINQGGSVASQPATLAISSNPLLLNVQVNINGNGGSTNYSGAGILGYSGDLWNQFTINYGVSTIGLLDSLGNLTPVTFTLANSAGSGNDSSPGYDSLGVCPLLASYYYTSSSMTVTLSGLNTNAVYTIITYDAGNAQYQGATLGGALTGTAPGALTFSTLNLGDDCLESTNIITDNSGNVTFTVSPPAGQPDGALDALQIEPQSLSSSSPPALSQVNPQSVSEFTGASATFSVRAISATPIISYTWLLNNVPLANAAGHISGASLPLLTISSLRLTDAGTYSVVVNNAAGASTNSAVLAVPQAPTPPAPGSYGASALATNPVAFWQLNETSGSLLAYDYTGNGYNGTYGGDGVAGTTAPQPPANGGLYGGFANGQTALECAAGDADSTVTIPPLNLDTNAVSITMWINPSGGQAAYTGLLMNRNGSDAAGFGFDGTQNSSGMTELGYTWNDNNADTYNFHSGLYPVAGIWQLVALVVQSNSATLYLYYVDPTAGTNFSSAVNAIAHTAEAFSGGTTLLGNDSDSSGRVFNGGISDAAVYNSALTANQILALFASGVGQGFVPATPAFTGVPAVTTGPNGNNQFVLTWSTGTLWQATSVAGPWTSTGATSPYTNNVSTAPQMFFKLSNP